VTSNEKILRSIDKAINNELPMPIPAGFCLKLVRLIVEDALSIDFYRTFLTHRVERADGDDNDPWARDLERSMRNAGLGILAPQANQRYVGNRIIKEHALPGDLLFRHDVAPTPAGTNVGHVGILMHHGLVFENINPKFRPEGFNRRSTSMTPLAFYRVTLVVRIP